MNPNSKSYDAHLRKSWELTLRATRDVELAIRLDPEVNVILPGAPYEVVFNALQNFREQLYFATEFPSCYKELIPLHREMRKAVGRENYEAAAKLRDEIKGVLLRAQPQIPKMVFSHGFFKNNEYF
ncbi:hypothetical protein D6745_03710 [Candidatus Woesearchaeota archaeon]|nr:MAG: hypothetical protein D6745_03710 [Candidatus Woesearchaeota archaeon]